MKVQPNNTEIHNKSWYADCVIWKGQPNNTEKIARAGMQTV